MARQPYNTRQRELVRSLMVAHANSYLTVDAVSALLASGGHHIGRTTVYRALERLSAEGLVAKVAGIRGEAAQYRGIPAGAASHPGETGQLRCVRCGRAFPLDCEMLASFDSHVLHEHGFAIDPKLTVLYGMCAACRAGSAGQPAAPATGNAVANETAAARAADGAPAAPATDEAAADGGEAPAACCAHHAEASSACNVPHAAAPAARCAHHAEAVHHE